TADMRAVIFSSSWSRRDCLPLRSIRASQTILPQPGSEYNCPAPACADRRRLHCLGADKRQGKNPPRSGIHGLVSAQISIDEALTGTDQIRQVRASASG